MKLLSFCLFWIMSVQLMAQDIIVKKNGDEVKAQVTEIGTDEIKFKKFDNINGPSYSLPKSELFMIKYSNGTKEIFNSNASTPVQSPTPSSSWSTPIENPSPNGTTSTTDNQPKIKSKIEGEGWRYYYDGRYLSEVSFTRVLKEAQINDGIKELEAGRKMKGAGKALTGTSIPFLILGPILTGIGAAVITGYNAKVDSYNNSNSNTYPYSTSSVPNREEYNTGNTLMGVGYGMFGFGVASLTTSIVLKSVSKKKYKKAAELYNAKL